MGRGGKQIVIVAADQSFPACVPSTDSRECIRVVRVEDGSLQEVIHALADAIGQSKLGTGTIIALWLHLAYGRCWLCTVHHRLGQEQDMA